MSARARSLFWWLTGFTGRAAKVCLGLLTALFVLWSILLESVLHGVALTVLHWIMFRLSACLAGGNPRSIGGAARLIAMALFVVAAGFGGYLFTAFASVERIAFPRRAHGEAVVVLKSTDDPRLLAEKVVPRRGVVLEFDDGSWLAIAYRDTHSFMVQTYILARGSDGVWLEGDHHFCGSLPRLQERAEKQMELHRLSLESGSTGFVGFMTNDWMFADTSNLDVATKVLKEHYGFREIDAP